MWRYFFQQGNIEYLFLYDIKMNKCEDVRLKKKNPKKNKQTTNKHGG